MGIGLLAGSPSNLLDVSGGIAIGSSFVGTAAPADGAIIEGNVGIGSSSPGEKLEINGAMRLANSSAPTAVTGFSGLYSASGELTAYDDSGNTTVISPHHFSLIQPSENMAWSFFSKNALFNRQINVDMLKMVRLIENVTGEQLVHFADLEGNEIIQDLPINEIEKLRTENKELKARLEKIENLLGLE